MKEFAKSFDEYLKCRIQGCIHEAQHHGELCKWHYFSNISKRKQGKAGVQQELDMLAEIEDSVDEIPVEKLVKKLSSG